MKKGTGRKGKNLIKGQRKRGNIKAGKGKKNIKV